MRIFIAIPCLEDLKEPILQVQREIRDLGKLKLVERENIHMTLKFLGNVEDDRIGDITSAVNFLSDIKKFELSLRGIGVFPSLSYVRVVWIGVDGGFDDVIKLSESVDDVLKPLGFPKEKKFHPHFTIARVKSIADKNKIRDVMAENSNREFGTFTVDEVLLMESKLTPRGPVYTTVESFKLK